MLTQGRKKVIIKASFKYFVFWRRFMKIALVGLGAISHVHIAAIKQAGESVVAICDIKREKALAFKEKYSLTANIYEDYKKMLDCEEIDVLHVMTPHYLHSEMICEGLSRNINVFSEKPVAISQSQLDDIHRALGNTAAQLGISHQNRYNNAIRYAKELFSKSEVLSAAGVVAWSRTKEYYTESGWRGRWATEGGGLVINQAIHTLDLLLDICGMPSSVIAHTATDTLSDVIEVEDTCNAIFKLPDGRCFSLMGTNSLSESLPCVSVFKSREHTVCIYNNDSLIVDGEYVKNDKAAIIIGKAEWGTGHSKIIEDFYSHIKENRHFPLDIYEAEKAIKLILALYKSNGREIEII
jgi:predicted dehydrogenase